MTTVWETERLVLRRFTEEDAEALLLLEGDPEVMRHVGRPPLPDAEAYRLRIRTLFLPQYERPGVVGAFAAVERGSGEFVGGCGLKPAEAAARWRDYPVTGPLDGRPTGWKRVADRLAALIGAPGRADD